MVYEPSAPSSFAPIGPGVCFREADCHVIRALLNASADAIALLSRSGQIIELNAVMARRLRGSVASLRGKCLWDQLPSPQSAARQQALESVFESGQTLTLCDRGSHRHYSHTISPVFAHDGHTVVQVAVFSRDITEQVRQEQQLRARLAELERSNRDLEAFAYAASHDLREPLRLIDSFAGLLEQRQKSSFDQDSREYMEFIHSGVKRLDALIHDLLDYARVGAHSLCYDSVSLTELALQSWGDLTESVHAAQATLEIEPNLPSALGFPALLERLLSNLFSNALSYRHPDRAPRLLLGYSQTREAWFVQDNGQGIAPEYHQQIFQLFQRINSTWQNENTGLGLAICRRVIDRHQGRIWVESSEGNGATFYFTLPMPASAEKSVRKSAAS